MRLERTGLMWGWRGIVRTRVCILHLCTNLSSSLCAEENVWQPDRSEWKWERKCWAKTCLSNVLAHHSVSFHLPIPFFFFSLIFFPIIPLSTRPACQCFCWCSGGSEASGEVRTQDWSVCSQFNIRYTVFLGKRNHKGHLFIFLLAVSLRQQWD